MKADATANTQSLLLHAGWLRRLAVALLVGDAQIHRAVAEVVAGLEEPFRQTIVLRFFHGA
jgi:hypothetical protein